MQASFKSEFISIRFFDTDVKMVRDNNHVYNTFATPMKPLSSLNSFLSASYSYVAPIHGSGLSVLCQHNYEHNRWQKQ